MAGAQGTRRAAACRARLDDAWTRRPAGLPKREGACGPSVHLHPAAYRAGTEGRLAARPSIGGGRLLDQAIRLARAARAAARRGTHSGFGEKSDSGTRGTAFP